MGKLSELLIESKVTAQAIVERHADPANQGRLQRFQAAFEAQAQLVAAAGRTRAVVALLALLENSACKPETIRKACSDVLKASTAPKQPSRGRTGKDSASSSSCAKPEPQLAEVQKPSPSPTQPFSDSTPLIPLSGTVAAEAIARTTLNVQPATLVRPAPTTGASTTGPLDLPLEKAAVLMTTISSSKPNANPHPPCEVPRVPLPPTVCTV